MKAVAVQNPWNAATVEREIPRPKEGEALLKTICGDIYGSNLASYRGMSAYVSYPRAIGHEFAVGVMEVGDSVYGIKPSMIATRNPYFSCGTCYPCHRGVVNCYVCNETMGAQREDVLSSYLTVLIGHLYDDQSIDPRELALIELFCIGRHGVSRASVKPGGKVLAFGAGAIGILAGVAAKSFGARVYITDIAGEEVGMAVRDLRLDDGFVNESWERLDTSVQKITDGNGFNVTAEAVGAPFTFLGRVQAVASRGHTVVIGVTRHSVNFNFLELQRKELDIYGSRAATTANFAVAMKSVKNGFVDLRKPISRTYPAGSAAGAFRGLNQNYGEIIRTEFES